MSRVTIIGGGIGGLAAANLLAADGHTVHLYEKNAQLGGRAGQLVQDGFRFDTGPSWLLMPEVFERYYRDLGYDIKQELPITRLTPAYKVWYQSAGSITITGDITRDAAMFESIEPGAGSKLRSYVQDSRELYDSALKHFLYTSFTPRELIELLHPDILRRSPKFLRLITRSLHDHVSRSFHDQRLQQILEYSSVFLGASPYETPALYSLMAALDFDKGVYYPVGGMYRVIESLQSIGHTLGVSYHTNCPAARILTANNQAIGIELENGSTVQGDIIISNADVHFTETRLLPRSARSYPDSYWQRKNPGPGALLLYLGVKGRLPEFEHHDLYFTDEWQDNFEAIYRRQEIPDHASLYVSRTSATDKTAAPPGHEALVVLVPFPPNCELPKSRADQLADRYIDTLARVSGVPDLATRIVSRSIRLPQSYHNEFNAWQSSALGPAHILRQSALLRTTNRSRRLSNLFYTGSTTIPGIGLPMCLISAELIRRLVAKQATRTPAS